MESRNKLTMCRLCLRENECFINVFEHYDMHSYIAAEVITDLLQFQVSKTDAYPHVVCSACLTKLTEFKLFKECCQKSKDTYDNMIVPRESPVEQTPEMVTIKTEEVIIDSSPYEVSEDPLTETEVRCGPILLKYEVLPFSRDNHPQDNMDPLDLEPEGKHVDPTEVEVLLANTFIHPKYPHCLEKKTPHITSKGELVANSCTRSINTNDGLIFEKTKNISLSEEFEASSSETMERMELQRILQGESVDMAPHTQQEKERVRMEQETGDGEALRGTCRVKGARER